MPLDLLLSLVAARLWALLHVVEFVVAVELHIPALRAAEPGDLSHRFLWQAALVQHLTRNALDQRAIVGDDGHIDAQLLRDRHRRAEHTPRRNRHRHTCTHRPLHRRHVAVGYRRAAAQQRAI